MYKLETIISLAKRRGFIFQSSEIYGGLNGCWDFGPLGVELLRNLKEEWWRAMTYRDDIEKQLKEYQSVQGVSFKFWPFKMSNLPLIPSHISVKLDIQR